MSLDHRGLIRKTVLRSTWLTLPVSGVFGGLVLSRVCVALGFKDRYFTEGAVLGIIAMGFILYHYMAAYELRTKLVAIRILMASSVDDESASAKIKEALVVNTLDSLDAGLALSGAYTGLQDPAFKARVRDTSLKSMLNSHP